MTKSKWQQDSQKEKAALFEAETGGFDISKMEATFLYAYSLWLASDDQEAREQLKIIDGALSFKTPPSDSTKAFFTEMFGLMPPAMAQDQEVQTLVASIKGKV